MADTGVTSPATATDNASVGTVTWSNVNNIFSSNNSYSDVVLTGTPGVVDSYSESNFSGNLNDFGTTYHYYGQSFTCTPQMSLSSVQFYISRIGAPTGNIVAAIYAHDGGSFGGTGQPTGAALAVSDNVDVSSVSTSKTLVTFTFSGASQIILSATTNYFVILQENGVTADASNKISIGYDLSSGTHGGGFVRSTNGSSWTVISSTNDLCFYVNGRTLLTSHYLRAYSFGFTVPTGSTITGVKVEIEQSLESGAIGYESRVCIVKSGGTIGSTNKATGVYIPTSDTYVTYGGVGDTWGESLTVADVNSTDFGVVFSAIGSNLKVQVDHVRITVYYTIPGGGGFFQIM